MAFPSDASVVILYGAWFDESTRAGMDATITATPLPAGSTSTTSTPNLTDIANYAWIKARTWETTPLASGLYALPLIANDDPDLTAFGGYLIQAQGEAPFIVNVSVTSPTITVSSELAAAIAATATQSGSTFSVAQGATVQAVHMTEAAVLSNPAPSPPSAFLSEAQTNSVIATAIAGLSGGGGGNYTDENARDAVGAALVGGTGITVTVDDTANTITIAATGGGGSYTDEQAQDALAALIAAGAHSGITFTYNDAGNAISATVSAQAWSQITGKPSFAAVATSGSASDITTGTLPDTVIPSGIARDSEVAAAVANLVNSAPGALDTLGELAAALQADEGAAATLTTAVGTKAPALVPTPPFTSNAHTPASGELARYNPAGAGSPANLTVTLPVAAAGQRFGLANVSAATTAYSMTFLCAGADTFSDGGTSLVLNPGDRAVLVGASGGFTSESINHMGLRTRLLEWTYAQAFRLVSATRDANEAITTASIVWPDGSTGTFTTDTASTAFPGAIDAYHVTYVPASGATKTVTQTAVTRDSGGAVTAQPALGVA